MSETLDMLGPDEAFATIAADASWTNPATIRVWRIDANGTPVEITKENTK